MAKFTSTLSGAWLNATSRQLDSAVAEMATDIHRRAIMLAPKDTRALVNSGVIKRKGAAHYSVKFGSSVVPYARIHELGGYTGRNGSVRIEAKHYLEKSGDGVTRGNVSKYIRST